MKNYRICITWFLIFSLLTGCSTVPLTQQESRLEEQSKIFEGDLFSATLKGALLGALGGALLGAGIGALTNGGKGAFIGVAAGATLGATGGAIYANNAEKNRAEAAKQKADAEKAYAKLKQENKDLSEYIKTAKSVIETDRKEYNSLNLALQQKKLSKEESGTKLHRLIEHKELLQKTLGNLKKRQTEALSLTKNSPKDTKQDVKKYREKIAVLEKLYQTMPDYNLTIAR